MRDGTTRSDDVICSVVSTERGQGLAKELGSLFVETSAKSGANIDSIFSLLLPSLQREPPHLLDDRQKCKEQRGVLTTIDIRVNVDIPEKNNSTSCLCFTVC